ncbi:NAD(P)/FAD-dependent oxidoreductase [Pseudonocardia acaciae]|uniref:NAD(P)/FAD-dependent oxidoreductase n=1 Tax=Pseudonocardia acaciae TaxID=551276 RepID=UPI0004920EC9|nr:FAD-dependent oxidoreductase [Pseudonocardia acaciae]
MTGPAVVIVGAGPAGLTAAARLAGRVGGEVLVLDRERHAGGIPRHSDHPGYGIRDLRTFLSGPAYARRLVRAAVRAGATIRTETSVTGWAGERTLEVTGPDGRALLTPEAIVLATGARERPRAARLVPGDRPSGVLTTGQLQNLVHLHHGRVGERAVVVGAELVSWSAVLTLRAAGCRTVLMVSRHRRPKAYAAFTLLGRVGLRTPVAARSRVARIIGGSSVEAVELEDLATGARRRVGCDIVVFTGDWIPDHELVRLGGLELDGATLGPRVDTALRTSRPGVFAAGNLVHAVDTADVAALDGRHVADQVLRYLHRPGELAAPAIGIRAERPLRWVAPSLLRANDPAPPRHRLLLWTDEHVRLPRVELHQGGRRIAHRVLPWPASPGRVFRVPSDLLSSADPLGGDITISLRRS